MSDQGWIERISLELPVIHEDHKKDAEGRPAGGRTTGCGLNIEWQDGPRGRDAEGNLGQPNGAFVESLIDAVIGRIRFYQTSEFACRENAVAITLLEQAKGMLHLRFIDRERRKVMGTNTK